MDTHGFLVMMHCGANTGYAIAPLEQTYYHTAPALTGDGPDRIPSTCPSLHNGLSRHLPDDFRNVREFDTRSRDPAALRAMGKYVREHRIDTALLDDPARHAGFARQARARAVRACSRRRQRDALTEEVRHASAACA